MSKEEELIKIQYKNKHHEKLEKIKKYKTIDFDLIPVIFEEKYEKKRNYKNYDDFTLVTDDYFSKCKYSIYQSVYQTNKNEYFNCSYSTSEFLHYYELEEEEIIKIIRILKEILKDVLQLYNYDFSDNKFLKSCGFIESIIFKKCKFDCCVSNCNVKISEIYFSNEAQYYTKNDLVCKKLLKKNYKKKFSNYFNYIGDYFSCLLENIFGSRSHIDAYLYGPIKYRKSFRYSEAYDQKRYEQNMILIKKYKQHETTIYKDTGNIERDYLVFKKLGFIFKFNDKKRRELNRLN